jgi:YVTN family beta-propeller protein/VCBS repeat-containing protein
MTRRARHREPFAWLGAGAVTLGMGAALAGAPALAHADETTASSTTSSAGTESGSTPAAATTPAHVWHLPVLSLPKSLVLPSSPKKPHRPAHPGGTTHDAAASAKAAPGTAEPQQQTATPVHRASSRNSEAAADPGTGASPRPVPAAAPTEVSVRQVNSFAPQVVANVTRAIGAVVRALESPWSASGAGGGGPVDTPVMWVLAAVARRQLGTVHTPAAATTVSGPAVVDAAPVFTAPTVITANSATGVVTGSATATDADSDKLTYSAAATKGTVTVNTGTGAFSYTPSAAARHAAASDSATDADRSATVTVSVTDGHGGTAATTIDVPVAPKNSAPAVTVSVGSPNTTTGVVAGRITATDADRDALAYSVTTTAAKGTLTVDASTGAYSYTPTVDARLAAAAKGATTADKHDTFTVAVDDGHGGVTAKTVTVSVAPLGDRPVAATPTVNAADATGTVDGAVEFIEPYAQLPLTYTVTKATARGTVTVDATTGEFVYTPSAAARLAAGVSTKPVTDKFTVTAANSITSTTETVTVTVAPAVLAVTGSVDKAGAPGALTGAVSPDGKTVYVSDATAGTVSAISGALTTAIPVGGAPGAEAINPSGSKVYVADSSSDVVSVIDTATDTVTGTITVGRNPSALLVSSDGATLYVANAGSNTVSVVNTATGAVTKTIRVGSTPSGLALKLDGSRLYVANAGSGTVTKINTATRAVTMTLKVGNAPVGLAVSPDGSALYVADTGADAISMISTSNNSVITTKLRVAVDALATGPDGGLYASDGADTVSVVSVRSGVDTPVLTNMTVGSPDARTGVVTGSVTFLDPSGKALTYKVITAPADGTVTATSAGVFTYTPTAAARLAAAATDTTDTFTIIATNGLATTSQTVTVPVAGQVNASVALKMVYGTEPVVYVSVNGGARVPVLVDTGSVGLVITSKYVGTQQDLGVSTGSGASGYSGGLSYTFDTYTTTVDFGNGIVSGPTSVDIVSSASQSAFASFAARDGVVGILGIGPNSYGPGPSSVISALSGDLNYGVLIDEQNGLLEFGPNPLAALVTLTGSPWTSVRVQVGSGTIRQVTTVLDSGGVYGTIPSWLVGGASTVPVGTIISVYTSDGRTLLYSYTTTASNSPTVTSDSYMNSGYMPFDLGPIYVSYVGGGGGQTVFDV